MLKKYILFTVIFCVSLIGFMWRGQVTAATLALTDSPLFVSTTPAPLMMIVLGRDHRMYFPAYDDSSDLTGDGVAETRYRPDLIDYDGYFDSHKCYIYTNIPVGSERFVPTYVTATKKCDGTTWSGDFLNYVTMTRMDILRHVLYGGKRVTDTVGSTILERSYIPQDAHTFGKEYDPTVDTYLISEYTSLSEPSSGNRHLFVSTTAVSTPEITGNSDTRPQLRVLTDTTAYLRNWTAIEAPIGGNMLYSPVWGTPITPTNYWVRVDVCVAGLLEDNCTRYTNGDYKPTGLLQQYGENGSMKFGLLTGSYTFNLAGGVIRRNLTNFVDSTTPSNGEIDLSTGQLTSTVGIIKTIDRLRIISFGEYNDSDSDGYDEYEYSTTHCGYFVNSGLTNGRCRNWGNPIAEMMFETMRYYSGKGSGTSSYDYNMGGTGDDELGLLKPAWINPYDSAQNARCAKPNMLVISDTYPSFDGGEIPGTAWGSFSSDISGFNASTQGQLIWNEEFGTTKTILIGESGSVVDNAPTPKTATSFGNIRGLAPEQPSQKGTYYAASVAKYAWGTDLSTAADSQKVKTYTLTFPTPMSQIKITAGGQTVYLTPFAKSIDSSTCSGSMGSINRTTSGYQPTNTVTYIYKSFDNGTTGWYLVNFESLEQGGNYDVDASVWYYYQVHPDNTVTINVQTSNSSSCIWQHIGYVISGTTSDGLYLEVAQFNEASWAWAMYGTWGAAVTYYLDTPAIPGNLLPTHTWGSGGRTFTPSATPSALVLESPLWYAAKWGGFIDDNDNGIPDQTSEWDADNDGVPDTYFSVTNPSAISTQLDSIFSNVIDVSSSSASTAVNTGSLDTNSRIYQALFNSQDWSGFLLAYPIIVETGQLDTTGTAENGAEWNAGDFIDAMNWDTERVILTFRSDTRVGISFRWDSLIAAQQTYLNTSPVSGLVDGLGSDRLNYLRGNRTLEIDNGGIFRNRNTLLGDIVNSAPVFVGAPNFPYTDGWDTGAPELSAVQNYTAFKTAYVNRTQVVYVGANDGFLHAINAVTGEELMAFMPNAVMSRANKLTSSNYTHGYYVDGSPTMNDAYFSTDQRWHTVLAAGLGKGGQGVYALDITNPTNFTENNASSIVLWEFTDNNTIATKGDVDLGYTFSQPSIVRMANGKWAAVFGNGYNNTLADGYASTTGNAVLYIVDITDGSIIKKIDTTIGTSADPTGASRPNGLASPAVVDVDGDYIADYIYAGDLFGNMWKFNVTSTNPASWGNFYSGTNRMFIAQDSSNNVQPITTRPATGRLKGTSLGVQIFFGTGKYLESTDTNVATSTMQTFYSLKDSHSNQNISGRSELLEQTILSEQSFVGGANRSVRVTSANALTSSHKGWYMDLRLTGGSNLGERQVTNSILRGTSIIFTTLQPSTDVCDFGGTGWLMELDAEDGSRTNESSFDLNEDGAFTTSDYVTYSGSATNVSGVKSATGYGIMQAPSIISSNGLDYKFVSTASGAIDTVTENPGAGQIGRDSWQQLK